MNVERIDHIHILVKDLEGAMRLFSKVMGTKFIGPIDRRKLAVIPRQCRYAFDTMGLEFVSPTSPDDPWGPILEKDGEGLLSLGLKVTDIDEAIAEFEANGVKLERRGEIPGVKFAIFYPEGACGVRFELVEYDAMQPVGVANVGKMGELPWFKG